MTLASDVFTLGIILTEYFTGSKPIFSGRNSYSGMPLIKGLDISFAKKLPEGIGCLIKEDVVKRPTEKTQY